MAQRHNHYEAAFEQYLRASRVAYVAVSQQRRSLIAKGSLKNLDFIVSPSDTVSLLVDIKGRRFPSGQRSRQYWKNWSTWDDLESLARWQDKLGPTSCSLLVFAYHVIGSRAPIDAERLFHHGDHRYAFLAVKVVDYVRFAKPLSQSWKTVALPTRLFRQAAFPFDEILFGQPPQRETAFSASAEVAVGSGPVLV